MPIQPEDIRNLLRRLDLQYRDRADSEEDGDWICSLWLPTDVYRFGDRDGFSTSIILSNKTDNGYEYLRFLVTYVYGTEDLSLENELLSEINRENNKWKLIKWTLTKGTNSADVTDLRLHAEVDLPIDSDKISDEMFFSTHGALYRHIENSWPIFAKILSLEKQVDEDDEEEPQNLDKAKLLEMFDSYLDEKFDNS